MNPIQQIEIVTSERGEPISGSVTPFMPFAQGGLNQEKVTISLP
jgi:hypothetical protein